MLEIAQNTAPMFNVLVLFALWAVYYFALAKFNKKNGPEWNSRILAFTHAFLVCRLIEVTIRYPWNVEYYGGQNSKEENFVLQFSLAYFIFETAWCFYMQTEGAAMLAHHVISLLSLGSGLYFNSSGIEMIYMVWIGELTNPFLQMRWFLRTKEKHKTWFAKINEMCFVVLFVIMRLFVSSWLLYQMWAYRHPNSYPLFLYLGTCMHTVNFVFLGQVFLLVKRRLLEKKKV